MFFCYRKDHNQFLPTVKKFRVPNVENVIEEGKKTPKKYRDITLHKIGSNLQTDFYTLSGWPSVSGDALKAIAGKVSVEYDFSNDASEPPLEDDPQISENKNVDISAYGTAYAAFGGGHEGMEACHAIASLCEICSIDSLISNFILPLQVYTFNSRFLPCQTFHAFVFDVCVHVRTCADLPVHMYMHE